MFENSKWIWHSPKFVADEYVTFVKNFNYESGQAILRLASETNYIAYLNGKRIAFGQFAGYKNKKYYDQIILNNLNKGENQLKITVWYEGLDTFTHIEDGAGLIFEVVADEKVLCVSDQTVLCGVDNAYVNYQKRLLTIQIGYTSSMVSGGKVDDFSTAVVIKKDADIVARPVKKLVEEQRIDAKKVDLPKKRVYDLGAESVGYLFLDIDCDSDCLVTVAYSLLFHMNLGYPMLDEGVKIQAPIINTIFNKENAQERISQCLKIENPKAQAQEECFYHSLLKGDVKVVNEKIKRSVNILYDQEKLPYLVEWKSMVSGDYALGIEPSTTMLDENFKYNVIKAQESIDFNLSIEVNDL